MEGAPHEALTPVISYSIGPSPVGNLLVAKSEKGLCAVQVRSSERELERTLRARFSESAVVRDERSLAPLRKLVLDAIAGKPARGKPPLDVRGTAFQRSVWRELQRIPAGATRSYAAVAKAIGKPRATRAVANACGANNLPVVIPCHRVIAKDGTIGGYTGGVHIKSFLLRAEGVKLRDKSPAIKPPLSRRGR